MAHTYIIMELDRALSILEIGKDPGTGYLIDAEKQAAADRAEAWVTVEENGGHIDLTGHIYFD